MDFLYRYTKLTNLATLRNPLKQKEKGNNNARNKTIEFHKYMSYQPIFQFNTSNETGRRSYFYQPLSKIAVDY